MNWVSIGSDNGLSPVRHRAITWTNADIILIGSLLKWNFNRNTKLFIHENAFEDVICKMVAILSRGDELNAVDIRHCSVKGENIYIIRILDNLCMNMVQLVDQSFYHMIFQGAVLKDRGACDLFDTKRYVLTVKNGDLLYDITYIAVLNFGVDIVGWILLAVRCPLICAYQQQLFAIKRSGPWFSIKISPYQYRKSHCGGHLYIESGPMSDFWLTQDTHGVSIDYLNECDISVRCIR